MELVAKEMNFISKEKLDSLVDMYLHKKITHECLIDCVIQAQKKLVISELCRSEDGAVAGEVLFRRMENVGIKISI